MQGEAFRSTINQENSMTISFSTSVQSPFDARPTITFTPTQDVPEAGLLHELPSAFLDAQYKLMDRALEQGNVQDYLRAKRSIRAHLRYHAMQTRDASRFPISHDDHLAQTAHQAGYHTRGDVERMTMGLAEVGEWQPPLVRKMNASRGVERVTYDVPGVGQTHDWLSIAQRDTIHPDRDRDELPSDYTLSSIALAEHLGVHVDDLGRGMSAKPRPNLPTCD